MVALVGSGLDEIFWFLCLIAEKYVHRSDPSGNPLLVDSANDTTRLWTPSQNTFRFFFHKNAKYVWNSQEETFTRLHGYDKVVQLLHDRLGVHNLRRAKGWFSCLSYWHQASKLVLIQLAQFESYVVLFKSCPWTKRQLYVTSHNQSDTLGIRQPVIRDLVIRC